MDLFYLKIIVWKYGTSITDELAIKALEKVSKARKANKGLIFQSYREKFLRILELNNIHYYRY